MLQQLAVGEAGKTFTPHVRNRGGADARSPANGIPGIALRPIRVTDDLDPIGLLPGTYSLGSAEDCDIQLVRAGVAPRHCTLVVGPRRTVVKARSPLTWINDGAVVEGTLRIGDRLILGPLEFRVVEPDADLFPADVEPVSEVVAASVPVVSPIEELSVALRQAATPRHVPAPPPVETEPVRSRSAGQLEAELLKEVQDLLDEFFFRERSFRDEMSRERTALGERQQQLETQSSALDFAQRHLRQEQERLRSLAESHKQTESRQSAFDELRKEFDQQRHQLDSRETELAERAALLSTQSRFIRRRELESRRRESDLEQEQRRLAERAQSLDALERTLDIDARFVADRQAEFDGRETAIEARTETLRVEAERLVEERRRLQDERRAWERTREEQAERIADREIEGESRLRDLERKERQLADREETLRRQSESLSQQSAALRESTEELDRSRQELEDRQARLAERRRELDWELAELDARQSRLDARETEWSLAAAEIADREPAPESEPAAPPVPADPVPDSMLPSSARRPETEETEESREQAELQELRRSLEESRDDLDLRHDRLRDEEASLHVRADELHRRSLDLERTREELTRSRADLERERKELERERAELDALRSRVEADRLALENERLAFEEERLAFQDERLGFEEARQALLDSPALDATRADDSRNPQQAEIDRQLLELREREARVEELETLIEEERQILETERETLRQSEERLETLRRQLENAPAPSAAPSAVDHADKEDWDALRQELEQRQAALESLEESLQEVRDRLDRREAEIEDRTLKLDERQESLLLMARQLKDARDALETESIENYAMGGPIDSSSAPIESLNRIATANNVIGDSLPEGSPPSVDADAETDSRAAGTAVEHVTYTGSLLNSFLSRTPPETQPNPIPTGRAVLSESKEEAPSAPAPSAIAEPDVARNDERSEVASGELALVEEDESIEEPKSEEALASRLRSELASMFGINRGPLLETPQPMPEVARSVPAKSPVEEETRPTVESRVRESQAAPRHQRPEPASHGTDDENLEDSVSRYMQRLLAKPEPVRKEPTETEPVPEPVPVKSTSDPSLRLPQPEKPKTPRRLRPEEKDAMRADMHSFRELALISGRTAVAKSTADRQQMAYRYLSYTTGASWATAVVLVIAETWMSKGGYLTSLVAFGIAVIMSLLLWKSRKEIRDLATPNLAGIADDEPEEPTPQGPSNPGGLTYV